MGGRVGSITTEIIADGLVFNADAANRASYIPNAAIAYNTKEGSITLTVNDSTSKIGADGDNLLLIGERMAAGVTDYLGEISILKIYNRILSSKEALQNYNALKSRFGL